MSDCSVFLLQLLVAITLPIAAACAVHIVGIFLRGGRANVDRAYFSLAAFGACIGCALAAAGMLWNAKKSPWIWHRHSLPLCISHQPPPPPAPPRTSQQEAQATIEAYFRAISLPAPQVIPALSELYGDRVAYHGSTMRPRAVVLKGKAKFAENWPERTFTLETDTLQVICPTDKMCDASASATTDLKDPRDAHEQGGEVTYRFRLNGQKIVAEKLVRCARLDKNTPTGATTYTPGAPRDLAGLL